MFKKKQKPNLFFCKIKTIITWIWRTPEYLKQMAKIIISILTLLFYKRCLWLFLNSLPQLGISHLGFWGIFFFKVNTKRDWILNSGKVPLNVFLIIWELRIIRRKRDEIKASTKEWSNRRKQTMNDQAMAQLQIDFTPADLELIKMFLKCTLNILFCKSYPHARSIT